MIEGQKAKGGAPHATAWCDAPDCRRSETVACAYHRGGSGHAIPDQAQIHTKLTRQGWAFFKGKLRCPSCEAKRKAQGAVTVKKTISKVSEIRKPTKEQKREIIQMLDVAYDTKAERYKGHDTDKAVAESLGSGVMPGWVAEIREDLFGPDGGNSEIENLAADIDKMSAEFDRECREFQALMTTRIRQKQGEFQKRIDAIKKSVGPRAARA